MKLHPAAHTPNHTHIPWLQCHVVCGVCHTALLVAVEVTSLAVSFVLGWQSRQTHMHMHKERHTNSLLTGHAKTAVCSLLYCLATSSSFFSYLLLINMAGLTLNCEQNCIIKQHDRKIVAVSHFQSEGSWLVVCTFHIEFTQWHKKILQPW